MHTYFDDRLSTMQVKQTTQLTEMQNPIIQRFDRLSTKPGEKEGLPNPLDDGTYSYPTKSR